MLSSSLLNGCQLRAEQVVSQLTHHNTVHAVPSLLYPCTRLTAAATFQIGDIFILG